ncbi:MAG: VWA domain-containing protein [Bacillota bacterium]|nr:VWA domain-containing protein [Bacillota bacterium]
MKKLRKLWLVSVVLLTFLLTACGASNSDNTNTGFVQNSAPAMSSAAPAGTSVQSDFNSEEYKSVAENNYYNPVDSPLSTFSIDVDTASYSNVRRFLSDGQLPPTDAVRIEELVNYFTYDYPQPTGNAPFSITTEVSKCPWNNEHYVALVGIQGKTMDLNKAPSSNLVFLLDVSGSMDEPNKLPLIKKSMDMLVDQLRDNDRISIVIYSGSAEIVLDSVPGDKKAKIRKVIDSLQAGGSTAGGEGIQLAYNLAQKNFIKEGNNRVILCTDGDFNVGISSDEELSKLIESRRDQGIYLSVMGFGTGNYKDSKMETLADKGNGNYAYIDTLLEANKVMANQISGTLFTIAKDVKVQIEFNPTKVKEYRLIGYENRILNKEDFKDDSKDAGELGAGHTVTALYEIVPTTAGALPQGSDQLKYQKVDPKESSEWMNVNLRYKLPDSDVSQTMTKAVTAYEFSEKPSSNLGFSCAVAEFGLLLKSSEYKGNSSYKQVEDLARLYRGSDKDGYRGEFIQLVDMASNLK